VAALIVALALANGFREELREKILSGTAHVTVTQDSALSTAEARAVAARIRTLEGITNATPTFYEGTLLNGPDGSAYAVLRGADAESTAARAEIKRTLVNGSIEGLFPSAEHKASEEDRRASVDQEPLPIVIGKKLAVSTGLSRVGDVGWIVTAERGSNRDALRPLAASVRVVGTFETGLHEYDSAWAYISLDDGARVRGAEASPPVISVELADAFAGGDAATTIRELLGTGWTTDDWRDANRPLFAALELERRTVSIIILLIMLVAALNITTTLALVVVERRSDVAVLCALGAGARSVTAIFIIEGALLGAVGAVAGIVVGLVACVLANYFELVKLPSDVYSISSVTLNPHFVDVVLPAVAAFAMSLLATLYPARQASRVRPAEALRYE
jgi:lipoprotein-releasing system permease protein